jgi:tape measure domain-containing protein
VTSNRTVEFKIQVDADTQGLEVFNRSLNALRKTTDASDQALSEFATEIQRNLNELKQSPAVINAVAGALKQLQQNMTAGSTEAAKLNGEIKQLQQGLRLTELSNTTQSLNGFKARLTEINSGMRELDLSTKEGRAEFAQLSRASREITAQLKAVEGSYRNVADATRAATAASAQYRKSALGGPMPPMYIPPDRAAFNARMQQATGQLMLPAAGQSYGSTLAQRDRQARIDAKIAERNAYEQNARQATILQPAGPFTNLPPGYYQRRRQELQQARSGGGFGSGGFFNRAGAISAGGFFGGPEGAIGGLIGGIGGAAAGAQIGILRKQVGEFATLSAQLDRYNIALKNVAGTEAEYQQALAAITSANERLNIPLVQGTQSFTQLAAAVIGAGGNIKDAELAFNAVNSAIMATGGNARDVEGAMLAITQVFSKGKVSAEELRRQLGDRLPGAFNLFAESIGKTGPELDEALKKGEVGLGDLMKFLEDLQRRYSGTAEEIAKSSQAAGDRLAAAWERARLSIGKAVQPLGAEIQEMFIKVLEDAAPKIEQFLKQLNSNPQELQRAVRGVGDAIRVVGGIIEGMLQSIQATTRSIIALRSATEVTWNASLPGIATNLLQGRNPVTAIQQSASQWQTNFGAALNDRRQASAAFGNAVYGPAAQRLLGIAPQTRSGTGGRGVAPTSSAATPSASGLLTNAGADGKDASDKAARDAERLQAEAARDAERLAAEDRRRAEEMLRVRQDLAQREFEFRIQLDERRYQNLIELEERRNNVEIAGLRGRERAAAKAGFDLTRGVTDALRQVFSARQNVQQAQFGIRQANERQQFMAQFEVPSATQAIRGGGGTGRIGSSLLGRLIGGSESYGGNYGAFNRGGSNQGHTAHGSGIDQNLVNMTIAEIQRRQLAPGVPRSQQLHAVGAYQIIGSTLRSLMQGNYGPTGVSVNDRFTPDVQDRLGAALAQNRVRGRSVEAGMRGLRQEWIGLQYVPDAQLRQAVIELQSTGGIPQGGAATRAEIGGIKNDGDVLTSRQELNFALESEKETLKEIKEYLELIGDEYRVKMQAVPLNAIEQLEDETELIKLRNRLTLEGADPRIIEAEIQKLEISKLEASQLRQNAELIEEFRAARDRALASGNNDAAEAYSKQLERLEQVASTLPALFKEQAKSVDNLAQAMEEAESPAVRLSEELTNLRKQLSEINAEPMLRLEVSIAQAELELQRLQDPVRQIQELAGGIGDAFGNSFGSIITGSSSVKEALANLFRDISTQFAQMASNIIAKAIEAQMLQGAQGGGGGIFGGLGGLIFGGLGGGFGGAAAVSPYTSGFNFLGGASPLPLSFSARGNAFGNSIVPFARGGIVTDPTVFKFARGGTMRAGVMAENAPEAILPLRRMPNGDLGVASRNGNGSGTVINNVSVSVDAKGSNVSGDGEQSRQLGKAISDAVQSELVRQQRPGGLLDRSRTKR